MTPITGAAARKHGHNRDDEAAEHHCDVTVSFNGVKKDFTFRPDGLVRKLLDHAIKEFHITQNPHTYALFNTNGVELNDSETLHNAGVRCEDMVLLRPSTVKAGKC